MRRPMEVVAMSPALMRSLVALLSLLVAVADPALAQHRHGEHAKGEHKHAPRFDNPEQWAKSFDDPERAAWQKPDAVIKTLALKSDARVADIGAGTGYFAVRLARALPGGTVYAVDLEPRMVDWLTDRAKTLGLPNMRPLRGAADTPNLPEPVDIVLLVNVYHHLDERVAYFSKLAASLRPGGRVAIIDQNDKAPRGPPRHMRLAAETIEAEMKSAGFTRSAGYDLLPYQSFQVFTASR
jgi:cyclopropane fatty-acyl-phospholipid synthase-like methyltransferase